MNIQNINNLNSEDRFLKELFDVKTPQRKGFMGRGLIIATMPHSDPGTTEFTRHNGNYWLTILAQKEYGICYGPAPRVAIAIICTEAVRTGSKNIYLGESLAEFMRKAGYSKSGGSRGTVPNMRNQLKRLFNATIYMHYEKIKEYKVDVRFNVASKAIYFWDDCKPENSWESQIILTDEFFREITEHAVPIDLNAVQALKSSSLALDIYMWLTYRIYKLTEPLDISWKLLSMQFGADYKCIDEFRKSFIIQLKKVLNIYPADVIPIHGGILIKPGYTHIHKNM